MASDDDRIRVRDAAVRRARGAVVGVAAGAVALSGLLSVVAAQAFKGHPRPTVTVTDTAPASTSRVPVPGPEDVPPIAGDPAPLQPPAQPPAAPIPTPSAPVPQVSGGS